MKKNGKKYRRIQKEKEQKRQNINTDEDREVDGIKISDLSIAQIVIENPITYDVEDTKKQYLDLLNKYVKLGGWSTRKYVISEIDAYEKIIFASNERRHQHPIEFYKYYILFDVLHLLAYETKKIAPSKFEKIRQEYAKDFPDANNEVTKKIINSVQGEDIRLLNLMHNEVLEQEGHYIELIRENIQLKRKTSFGIMVTATMSSGKSTFINSLVGKYVCLSQNMACTSKIHSIINKSFEDGYSTEYDHDLVMTAGRDELLNDNEENLSDVIFVSTHYVGELSDSRIVINDSPGVNFSGDESHQKIANQLIKRRNYKLLIYVMNATQLGTNDEEAHLDFIKRTIGRTPVIFVMNKIDSINPDEEDVDAIISRQKLFLERKGFKNPIICPVSAWAGYLSKKRQMGCLTKSEERELYNLVDKFDKMNLGKYYEKTLPKIKVKDNSEEEIQLQKTCGLLYIEQLIKTYSQGGK